MAVHKYTYYEANNLYKNNRRSLDLSLREFPVLPKDNRSRNHTEYNTKIPATITRQTYSQKLKEKKDKSDQENNIRSITTYSQRKRPQPQIPGYNHEEHKRCIIDTTQKKGQTIQEWERTRRQTENEDNIWTDHEPLKEGKILDRTKESNLRLTYKECQDNIHQEVTNKNIHILQDYKLVQTADLVHNQDTEEIESYDPDFEMNNSSLDGNL
ncbi:uncharacterized protein LOC123306309 [Coccinella septempunctata]|uniref:uncharacterized protein LOC123306309 n=1 Tax=Coccinella septempunctata TaxID=41139 RepID=UPI001D077418|nr:uncharacterized protein LOC123306309 [Coccinella septempunctata]